MGCLIRKIFYSPVKSISFDSVNSIRIKKSIGLENDRIFSFSRNIDFNESKLIELNPNKRSLHNFLTLRNSPFLNKYNFTYKNEKLTLTYKEKELLTISPGNIDERSLLSNKLTELESSLTKPIFLLKNNDFPFYDTSHSNKVLNSMSLINLNSVADCENKINQKVEFQRFRANFYVEGIEAWKESNWINKTIKINNVSFKVEKKIPRCVAINLKPKTDVKTNLLGSLKEQYNHFEMGIYLTALVDGEVNIGDKIDLI